MRFRFWEPTAIELSDEAERLCGELLIAFEDLDDDDWIPVCAFMRGVGRLQGLSVSEVEEAVRSLPPWETVGWFRERIRENMAALARGDGPKP